MSFATAFVHEVAKVCHEANKALCEAFGDDSQVSWADAPQWQRTSTVNGVLYHLATPNATPESSHEKWLEEKRAAGWKWGPNKDPILREHPCFCAYDDLPVEQRAKDYIFCAIVNAMR